MAITKKQFQDISAQITQSVTKFTNNYPNNWGEIAQRKISFILIILGILFLGLPAFLVSDASVLVGWFGGPALLIIGIKKLFKDEFTEPSIQNEQETLNSDIRKLENDTKNYSDVQQYCKDMYALVSESANQKNKMLKTTSTIIKCSIIGSIVLVVLGFIFTSFHLSSYLQEFLATGINEREFMEINQYQGDGKLKFSICDETPNHTSSNTNFEFLYIDTVNISQTIDCKKYLIKFVDENGIAYPEFPMFPIEKDSIKNNCRTGLWCAVTQPGNLNNKIDLIQLLKRIKNNKVLYKVDCYDEEKYELHL